MMVSFERILSKVRSNKAIASQFGSSCQLTLDLTSALVHSPFTSHLTPKQFHSKPILIEIINDETTTTKMSAKQSIDPIDSKFITTAQVGKRKKRVVDRKSKSNSFKVKKIT